MPQLLQQLSQRLLFIDHASFTTSLDKQHELASSTLPHTSSSFVGTRLHVVVEVVLAPVSVHIRSRTLLLILHSYVILKNVTDDICNI